jgi:hypothetical protein
MPTADIPARPIVGGDGPKPARWVTALASARALHALMKERAREGHLSYSRQFLEMAILKARHGIGVNYYQTAGFFRRDIPWAEKSAHLGASDFVRRLERLNPVPYRKLSQHKLAEKALLTLLGVPTPRYLGYAHRLAGRTAAGRPLRDLAEFERFIDALDTDRICFKLMEGHGGAGFVAVERHRTAQGTMLRPIGGGEPATVPEFFDRYIAPAKTGRLVEEYLEQHPSYNWFNETSVNTLRVWAYAPAGGPARVIGAYLRIGRQGALVDNHVAGGLIAPIEFETGTLRAAVDGLPSHRVYKTHPDSGRQLEGIRLEHWRDAMEVAATTLTVFPRTRLAGMDIAITTNGPCVIELNNYPGLDGVGVSNLQLARILGD